MCIMRIIIASVSYGYLRIKWTNKCIKHLEQDLAQWALWVWYVVRCQESRSMGPPAGLPTVQSHFFTCKVWEIIVLTPTSCCEIEMNSASHMVSTTVFHQIQHAMDCKTHHHIVDQERKTIPIKLWHAFDCNTSLFQKCCKVKKRIS